MNLVVFFFTNKTIYCVYYAQVVNIFMNIRLIASKALPARGKRGGGPVRDEAVTTNVKMIKKYVILIDCLHKKHIVHRLMHNEWRIKGQPSEKGTSPTRKARSPRPDMKNDACSSHGGFLRAWPGRGMKKASEGEACGLNGMEKIRISFPTIFARGRDTTSRCDPSARWSGPVLWRYRSAAAAGRF